jgi:hypothetical protein
MVEFDYKEYARQMRENAVKDNNGNIICSPELWEQIASIVENMPTADVEEVKHGEWLPIVIQDNYLEPPYCDTIKCSECGETADVSFHDAKYCYMCGAKMDRKEDEE